MGEASTIMPSHAGSSAILWAGGRLLVGSGLRSIPDLVDALAKIVGALVGAVSPPAARPALNVLTFALPLLSFRLAFAPFFPLPLSPFCGCPHAGCPHA
eukprot:8467607-Heterocapsa_arctica.AAC.1